MAEPYVDKLHQLGYLWHVKQDELQQLAPGDPELKRAILNLQEAHALEYAALQGKHYGGLVSSEGVIGPAVAELLDTPRGCPLPDVPPPPGVAFHFDDPDLQRAVESQQRLAAIQSDSKGSGSWPYACWDGYTMHRVVVAADLSNASPDWIGEWPRLVEQCRMNNSWGGVRFDFVAAGARADIRLEFVSRSGGWIGLAEFPSGRCTDEVFCKLLKTYSPNRRRMLNLLQHELGHNLGFQHTPGNWIMSPVINDADPDWREDTHWKTFVRYFGGKGSPAILGDDPDPVPPPPDPEEHNGVLVIDGKLRKIKVWDA